jgi:hypothetical protein
MTDLRSIDESCETVDLGRLSVRADNERREPGLAT